MSSYLWTATGSTAADPLLGSNWTKSDGTTGTAPTTGDDLLIVGVPGVVTAPIWASGGAFASVPGSLSTSGASTTGGNLAANTPYYYKITATNANGESLASSELTYTTPNNGLSTNQITVNWAAVSGATGYKIYRSTTSGAETYLASVGNVLLYADTGTQAAGGSLVPGAAIYNSLTIAQSYQGTIGVSGFGGYWLLGATTVTIGSPNGDGTTGSGSGRIKLNFQGNQYACTVINTGASTDSGFEPVRLLGSNASNKLYVQAGRVGVATNQQGETAMLSELDLIGTASFVELGIAGGPGAGVTLTNVNVANGGTLLAHLFSGTVTASISATSSATFRGATGLSTVSNNGTATFNNRPAAGAAVGTLNAYDSSVNDFSNRPDAATISTLNLYSGAVVKANPAKPSHLTISNLFFQGCGTLTAS